MLFWFSCHLKLCLFLGIRAKTYVCLFDSPAKQIYVYLFDSPAKQTCVYFFDSPVNYLFIAPSKPNQSLLFLQPHSKQNHIHFVTLLQTKPMSIFLTFVRAKYMFIFLWKPRICIPFLSRLYQINVYFFDSWKRNLSNLLNLVRTELLSTFLTTVQIRPMSTILILVQNKSMSTFVDPRANQVYAYIFWISCKLNLCLTSRLLFKLNLSTFLIRLQNKPIYNVLTIAQTMSIFVHLNLCVNF